MERFVCALAKRRVLVLLVSVIGATILQIQYILAVESIRGGFDPLLDVVMPIVQVAGSFLLGLLARAIVRAGRRGIRDASLRFLVRYIPVWYLVAALQAAIVVGFDIARLNPESILADYNLILSGQSMVVSSIGIVFLSLPAACGNEQEP